MKNIMQPNTRKPHAWIGFMFALVLFTACDLNEEPKDTATIDVVFGSEAGLELYTNSFYTILPSASTIIRADAMTDYGARTSVSDFLLEDAYTPNESSGWSWRDLRNINYFIENCTDTRVSESVRKHYIGLAKFFRAWFYFDKVKRFGDVPWINKAMDVEDADLYAGRDSRMLVIDSVLADLDYACENMTMDNDDTHSLITTYVAYAFKSRVCLFEGTFRKYHTELADDYDFGNSADELLQEARDAAKKVIDESGFTVYTGDGTESSYRQLFISSAPIGDEIMLSAVCDETLSVYNDANWWWTSSTYGERLSFTRTFINTYLTIDGTPFTSTTGYETKTFMDEVKNRDKRLQQTIRMGDYQRISSGTQQPAPPVFSYTYTGYQPIKWCLDDMYYDGGTRNINSISIMRYAEVLLNYAEARAELDELTDADWALTIGALRARAGITGGLTQKPTTIDSYLQDNYFADITDASLLEIRRERGIELALEGFRYPDILRWKHGELMTQEWNGFYVPALNVPMDLNEDGINDVCFYKVPPTTQEEGVTYVSVAETVNGVTNPQRLKNDTFGELTWLTNIDRYWEDKNYLYPIPTSDLQINPALGQNRGW